MATFSFKDVGASIEGPGGNINLGYGASVADEGITVEDVEDRNTMTTGADGDVMHSLHASDAGTVRVRLLKTSGTNALLMQMFNLQSLSGASWGDNTIVIRDHARGDIVICSDVAFTRRPTLGWAKAGPPMYEWTFTAGHVNPVLGQGRLAGAGVGAL
jgi:hypothetical protein